MINRIPHRFIVYLLLIIVAVAYSRLWHSWSNGQILVMSRNTAPFRHSVIEVWQLPETFSVLGPFLGWGEDNFTYRFDYYPTRSSSPYSSLLFTGESFHAKSGKVNWHTDGSATVYLDNIPMFDCDKNGTWHPTSNES